MFDLDLYFMDFAIVEAKNAYDNKGKVGCVIVYENNIISRAGSDIRTETHAEYNAILNTEEIPSGSVMYVTYQPCIRRSSKNHLSCSEYISNAGISDVVFGAFDPNFGIEESLEIYKKLGLNIRAIDDTITGVKCKLMFDESFSLDLDL